MATRSIRSSTSVVLLVLLPLLFVSSSAHNKPELPSLSCDVKSVCLTAPFPDLCRTSTSLLSPHGSTQLPLVIRGVLGLSISAAKAASFQVRASSGFGIGIGAGIGVGIGGSSAKGCGKTIDTAVEVLEGAMKEVNRLSHPRSIEYAHRVAGVKTLVNKAVANCNTCLRVLRGVPSGFGPINAKVSVEHTMELSSNLLVFVNKLQAAVKH